jgi:hypothetical protein
MKSIVTVLLGLCATAASANQANSFLHTPALGVEARATTGSVIYERATAYKRNLARLQTLGDYSAKMGLVGAPINIPHGTVVTRNETGPGYCTDQPVYRMALFGPQSICLIDSDGDNAFDRFSLNVPNSSESYRLRTALPYQAFQSQTAISADGFRQTLTFLGAAGGVLRLSYREFRDDVARPAFTEELTYTAPSAFPDVISFRDIEIVVEGLDNSGLRYRVRNAR